MNQSHCEREKEIIDALRGRGRLDAELEKHASTCPVCSDTIHVSRFLQAEFLHADATTPDALPHADFIWWKGQLAAKQAAVDRATRSIALVRNISYLSISAAAAWLVFAPGHLAPLMSALSKYQWPGGSLREAALFAAIGAIIFTLLSSFYLARAER
jgi:hypothetical protein